MSEGREPVVLVATFRAKPETWGELRDRLEKLVVATLAEPGCVRYELHADVHDPHRFVFVEEWADADALAAHNRSEHLQALLADVSRLTAETPAVNQLRRIA